MNYFFYLNPIIQVLIAGIICFIFTSAGAFLVLLCKNIKQSVFDGINSISSGIMISAAFFSLLLPAINSTKNVFIVIISFIIGGLFIYISNKLLEKLDHMETEYNLKRCFLLFTSITLHNIPEGISIAIPIYYSTKNIKKAFIYTLISGFSELLGAILAFLFLSKYINNLTLGIILSLTAGIMIHISIYELIPNALLYKNNKVTIIFFLLGSLTMLLCSLLF